MAREYYTYEEADDAMGAAGGKEAVVADTDNVKGATTASDANAAASAACTSANLADSAGAPPHESASASIDVSVILPIYNTQRYLDQALASVRQQTLQGIEIICVNDGSTDGSLEIMKQHAAQDARVRIIDKPNEGYGASCNRGIAEARGRYLAIVEPDDWILPDMLARLVQLGDSFDKPIDIVKSPYWRIWMPDTPEQRTINCSYRGRIKPAAQPFTIHDAGVTHLLMHHPSIWSAIYRTAFLRDAGIAFRAIPGAGWADNPFLYETLLQAKTVAYLDEPFYCYREETPEKTKSAALNNTLVPFERWHDIKDVCDRLEVADENILRALNERGFTYLSGTLSYVQLHQNQQLKTLVNRMFMRMEADLVMSDASIAPGMKALFAQARGIDGPNAAAKAAYMGNVVAQGIYNLKNTGPAMTLTTLKGFLGR